jgi:hypothetical protein
MGVTCSLLGHDYGDVQTDREREERGDEVILTVRELRVCSRCGSELVMSENTEVRPVRSAPEDAESDSAEESLDDESWSAESATAGSASGTRPGPEVDIDADVGPETSSEATAEGGDGMILDSEDETDPAERGPGEWPDADDTRLGDERANQEATEETSSEAEASEETEILDAEPDEQSETAAEPDSDQSGVVEESEAGSDWPDPGPGGSEEGFDETTPSEAEPDDDLIEPEPGGAGAAVPSSESTPTGDVLLACDSCAFREGAVGSSHRSGDICPECKRGYLQEQAQ